jgi:hypothetical protein
VGLQEGAPADEDTDAAWSANADAITGLGFIYLAEPSRQPHTTRVGYPFCCPSRVWVPKPPIRTKIDGLTSCTHRNSARSRFEWNRRVPCCQDGRWRRRSVLVGCTNSVVGRNPRDLQRNRICAPHNNRRRPGRLDRGTTAHQPRLTSVVRTASSSWAWRFSGGQRKSSSGWAAESSVPSRPFRLAPERTRRPRSPNRPLLTLAACRSFHDEVSPWKHQTGRSKPGERGNTSTTRRPRVGFSLSASRAVRSLATSPSERSALGGDKTDRSAHLRQR